jgi:hypothetical protein
MILLHAIRLATILNDTILNDTIRCSVCGPDPSSSIQHQGSTP